jgi:hypothetical protein
VLKDSQVKQGFPPSVKKGKANDQEGKEVDLDLLNGSIAHLARECDGNMYDCQVVDITCGSFKKEKCGANPH